MNSSAEENEQPIRFSVAELGPKRHVCGFFRTAEEEYRLLLPFIRTSRAASSIEKGRVELTMFNERDD
jgi:hypothetical protein